MAIGGYVRNSRLRHKNTNHAARNTHTAQDAEVTGPFQICTIPTYHLCSVHTGEVNQLKCNASGTRLASCADDATARIYDIATITNTESPILVLTGHSHTLSTLIWCPTTPEGEHELLLTCVPPRLPLSPILILLLFQRIFRRDSTIVGYL